MSKTATPIRIVTSTSLFDGHDVSINIMRRILQDHGAEVIHLGHDRSAPEIVNVALQEDADAIAISSYQGGHIEFFKYVIDLLKEKGAAHIQVFGGGGGVILPKEIVELERYGVNKLYSPEDGREIGLVGIIDDMVKSVSQTRSERAPQGQKIATDQVLDIAAAISQIERSEDNALDATTQRLIKAGEEMNTPVLGLTGTGGAGKSSLTDELLLRFLNDFDAMHIAVLSIDPTRRKTGGALLGDRIRMNSAKHSRIYMRSMATRYPGCEVSPALKDTISMMKAAGFDLILVETAGIGQGDAAITSCVDSNIYVMTAEFGGALQLEKIEMLDYANWVVVNKFDHKGAEDALKAVSKQYQRTHHRFNESVEEMPVFGTQASWANDEGVNALYLALVNHLNAEYQLGLQSQLTASTTQQTTNAHAIVPAERIQYLAEIARTVRNYHEETKNQAKIAQDRWQLKGVLELLQDQAEIKAKLKEKEGALSQKSKALLEHYPEMQKAYAKSEYTYEVRGKKYHVPLTHKSLAGNDIPKKCLPKYQNDGDILTWLRSENVPGQFPYTAGVFPFKRADEENTRMFAGEGDAKRTNTRFHLLSKDVKAKRLSTAFDPVTLYGEDPDERPDIYGTIGTSGVSICTVEDMAQLYEGFDLCAPNTSVSMTINGPAPIILAFFFNTAINQQLAKFEKEHGRAPSETEHQTLLQNTFTSVRGTVQADILKEDQGQNTCIFATDFSLKMMGDIQAWFIKQQVRHFYSVSIAGYHIAEAGANPITQLAFTLSNGFTYVEYYLSRGMHIDDFAPNLSFFFSLSLEPECAVLNRVARRIWAVAMRERYGANARSQKLKAHMQTSGRTLHAQEIQFNDIRTTLEALLAMFDNCNSLHTNAFDEAVTTPTQESVRRALAIQLIIEKEFGPYKSENFTQGSFVVESLTDLVEEAVLKELERLSQRGGVLGAMELGYQRNKIQEESHHYESQKVSGEYPIVGVNMFKNPEGDETSHIDDLEVIRATDEEKQNQIKRLNAFKAQHKDVSDQALSKLKEVARSGGNIFAELMDTVKFCSLGQITQALYEVGGAYRRNV